MGFYYLTEKRKFDAEWEKLRAEYEAAGMDEESIEKMKLFDWGWFCSRRSYENHTQPLPDPEGYEDDEKSILFRKFGALSVFFDESQTTDRMAWLEYIEDERLYERLRSLSYDDLDLITLLAMEDYTQAEIARLRGCCRNVIYKKVQRIKKFLQEG